MSFEGRPSVKCTQVVLAGRTLPSKKKAFPNTDSIIPIANTHIVSYPFPSLMAALVVLARGPLHQVEQKASARGPPFDSVQQRTTAYNDVNPRF